MPPPLFVFCLPGFAIIFLIQVLICEAYHFHVTISHKKRKTGNPDKDKNQGGKSERGPRGNKDRRRLSKDHQSKGDQEEKGSKDNKEQGRPNKDHQSKGGQEEKNSRDTKNFDNDNPTPEDEAKLQPANGKTMRSTQDNGNAEKSPEKPKNRPHVDFDVPEQNMGDENKDQSPKEDRQKGRRKSVFAESYDPSKDDEDLGKVVHPKTPEEKEWLIENVRNITLFEHLANDQTTTVVDAMYKRPVSEGDFVMKQGDKGSTFYIVQTGIFDVYVKDAENVESLIHTYDNKGSFGELALLYNQPRAATIVARTDGQLWAVDGHTFRRIVHKITYQKRIMYESLINNVPMLKTLEPYERANLVDALIPMTFKHNDEIIKQGTEGDGMYFIISGGVRIMMRTINNRDILLKELSNSEYFGELALVTDKPRAASAFAIGDTHLAFLDREAFERLLGPCMDVIKRHIDNYNEQLLEIERAQEQ
ncbi:cAMP-dependent protein kinase type II regulatory subunit-like isoform X1 [Homalodisca vitripennis]|uniref:cAMP-dependent protein kinase type II regulatory subunit-like isoform X1 n=1 Tax=Homalodisca vitripennis TaxID=197043 RepID=UPI001EEC5E96|nr:cAMP-dependent protein kinase type II regulatory subunit-like isoform X1 [Homalodisca vitripennis]